MTITQTGDTQSTISAPAGLGLSGSGQLTFNVLDGASAIDLDVSSPISNASGSTTPGIIKTGYGTLRLDGANTYTGPTTLNAGTVFANNASALGSASAVTVNAGATLAIGSAAGAIGSVSTGVLTVNGGVLAIDLAGTAAGTTYDQVNVTGTTTLTNAVLNVSLGYSPNVGDSYTILSSTGAITGTFAGLPNNSVLAIGGQYMQIAYGTNSVTLTDVAAPVSSIYYVDPTTGPQPTSRAARRSPTPIRSPAAANRPRSARRPSAR